ncbi:GumC family protein [Almyronema epifaneia]|uniref:GumC family protein n=1 Tax=Almyronema epifaneia S1 TaxID=2991925 RepID=A0ABW6IGD9_9CYAN
MMPTFVKRYLIALNRYKWAGLAGFLAVFGASGVVALQPPPPQEYVAEGALIENAPILTFTATGSEIQASGQGIFNKEVLLADILLQQVSDRLESQGTEISPENLRRQTAINVTDEGEGSRRSVTVRYTSEQAEEAEAALSLLFEGMVEFSRFNNKARLRSIIDALNERLPGVETELRNAEQALERYDRIEGPAIQASLDGSLLGAISASQGQRRQNQVELASIDAQMRSLQARLGMTPEQAYASSALSADPIIADLRAKIYSTESQMQLLSAQLRPAHPTMVELRQQRDAYTQLLRERAGEVIGGGSLLPLPSGTEVRQDSSLDPARAALANQLVALQTLRETVLQQQQTLAQSEQELRQQYASIPNKQLERGRLAQQVALKQALYDQIQAKRIDAEAAEAETVSSLTVSKPPLVRPVEVEATNALVILAVGGLIGLVAGGAIVYLLDMLDSTVRTHEELENILRDQEVPILSVIPTLPVRSTKALPLMLQPDSPYEEIYERFRSNIQLVANQSADNKQPKVILITSTKNSEGKTLSAYNLAIASARAGKRTLLVEADLRAASQSAQLGITPERQATIEPLRYYGGKLGDNIRLVPSVENLYISPSPGPQRQAAAILESSEMRRFFEDARIRFDMVILDAPALSHNNDAMLLETQTDGIILVTRPNHTEKTVLLAALEQLEEADNVRLLGAIVNSAEIPIATAAEWDDIEPLLDDELEAEPEYAVPIRPIEF